MPKRSRATWRDRQQGVDAVKARYQAHLKQQKEANAVPFVEIKGQKFYSDRFYLNATIYDDETNSNNNNNGGCCCGAVGPPPLLDRAALVQSLDLKAAILGTYTLERGHLAKEYPNLFGANATVPTLVLHGAKGKDLSGKSTDEKKDDDNGNDSDCESFSPDREDVDFPIMDTDTLHKQQVQSTNTNRNEDDSDDDDDAFSVLSQPDQIRNDAKEFCTWAAKNASTKQSPPSSPQSPKAWFPSQVHFTEVFPMWLPLKDLPEKNVINSDGSISEKIVQKRRYKQGVHHPKYMLLFETSGSLVVLVSTSNLTCQRTTDGTWVQRFQPSTSSNNKDYMDCFGKVLGHFLDCSTWASQPAAMTPLGFGREHLGWTTQSCHELANQWDFSRSQVVLVPHVPGDYDGANDTTTTTTCKYGRQFVSHILRNKQYGQQRPWLPPSLLSEKDRLIFQPTSLGGQWQGPSMAKMVSSYMDQAGDESDDEDGTYQTTVSLLNKMDIVWPTDDWIKAICVSRSGNVSRSSVARIGFVQEEDTTPDKELALERKHQGYIFLSSVSFNSIDLDCLSRMVMFEPSSPSQQPRSNNGSLVPHFKSISRLYEGKKYPLQKDYGVGKSSEYLSWFMLTSACLSRGAQGYEATTTKGHDDSSHQKSICSYTNFELGVLFCSRLQGRPNDRLYCYNPSACSCGNRASSNNSSTKLIHLPIPFDLRPSAYQQGDLEDNFDFCETPFFNEIPKGTGNTGNMKFTPYGSALGKRELEL